MTIRDEFLADVQSAINQCYELNYAPTRFEKMIEVDHPVEVAKRFVISGEFQHGFKELNKKGKPELTIEGIMLKSKYQELFTKEELDAARWRIQNVNTL